VDFEKAQMFITVLEQEAREKLGAKFSLAF